LQALRVTKYLLLVFKGLNIPCKYLILGEKRVLLGTRAYWGKDKI
jgi:hypothetical protein